MLSPGQVVQVLVVGNEREVADGALYLSRALAIGSSPAFEVETIPLGSLTSDHLRGVTWSCSTTPRRPPERWGPRSRPSSRTAAACWIVSGERSAWPPDGPALLPGALASPADRDGRGGSLGFVDYSHPVFELFGAPAAGTSRRRASFGIARSSRRTTPPCSPGSTTAARPLVERRHGEGRVLLWASTLDNFWNDLALKPVYLPFVHRLVEHLGDYVPPTPWFTAGQVLDLAEQRAALVAAGLDEADLVAIAPSGGRVPLSAGGREGFLTLAEQGFYEIRDGSGEAQPLALAVNVDLAESDLTAVDPDELAGSLTGRAGGDREALGAVGRCASSPRRTSSSGRTPGGICCWRPRSCSCPRPSCRIGQSRTALDADA